MQSISDAACASRSRTHVPQQIHVSSATTQVKTDGGDGFSRPLGGVDLGLVSSQTSGTPRTRIEIIPHETRLKRLKFSVLTAARLHVRQKPKWKVAMLTLTYAPDRKWGPNQVSGCLRHIRQYLKRKGVAVRHVWVMEYTKRGRPHYHVLLWLPLGLTLPKPDKRGWWPYGMTKIEWAKNAVGYIAKYASKGDSLTQPEKGARMHGNGGVTGDSLLEQRWWKLPSWVRDPEGKHRVVPADRVARRKGGGLIVPATGEVILSPWEVIFKGGRVFIQMKEVV